MTKIGADRVSLFQPHSWDVPAEEQAEEQCVAGGDPLPAGSPPPAEADKPGATSAASANATVAATTAPPAAPKASKAELASIDLVLADPLNRQLIEHYAGSSSLPVNDVSAEIVKHYGAQRAEQLQRLAEATAAVRDGYVKALQEAASTPPPAPFDGRIDDKRISVEYPGWSMTAQYEEAACYHTHFDIDAFTAVYAKKDTLSSKAFATLYGKVQTSYRHAGNGDNGFTSVPTTTIGRGVFEVTVHSRPTSDGECEGPTSIQGEVSASGPLAVIDLKSPPDLHDKRFVGFDPTMGFITQRNNIVRHQGWLDRALPVFVSAIAIYCTADAASNVGAWASTATEGAISSGAASAAFTAAVSNVASGMVTGNLSVEGILASALTAGVSQGVLEATGFSTMGLGPDKAVLNYAERAMGLTGQATVAGALEALAGGDFEDAFKNSLSVSLAAGLANEITEKMSAAIEKLASNNEINAFEASACRTLTIALRSAISALGDPTDPGFAAASEFVRTMVKHVLPAQTARPKADAATSVAP